jgi:phosphatidylethanolamine/phosphatidyl-N-methylethanolamine N-methyltransferase
MDESMKMAAATDIQLDSVATAYDRWAPVYDLAFGPVFRRGRSASLAAAERIGGRILEVGVGTGINISLYPRDCQITGIDLSTPMLEKAHERVSRDGFRNVRLFEMDAAKMTFPDDSFDIVYAPYLVSVVPDPVQVAREMRRVCKPGGKIIILNHFRSTNPILSRMERAISPFTVHIGFKADLDLAAFLAQAELAPISVEKVNVPRIWSLVTCRKDVN